MIVIAGDDHLLNNSIPATIARVNVMENYNYAGDCFPVAEWIALDSKKDAIEKTIEILKEKLKEIKVKLVDHVEKNHLDPVELKKLAK
jgi:hypothetical protein